MSKEIFRVGDLVATSYVGSPGKRSRSPLAVEVTQEPPWRDSLVLSAEDSLQLGRALHLWASEVLGVTRPAELSLVSVQESILALTQEAMNVADYLADDPTISGVKRSAETLRVRASAVHAALSLHLRGGS